MRSFQPSIGAARGNITTVHGKCGQFNPSTCKTPNKPVNTRSHWLRYYSHWLPVWLIWLCTTDCWHSTVLQKRELCARGTSRACARNENGDFCGTVPFRFFPTDQTQASTCLEAVTSGSCPSTCHNFLQSVSSRLGCCINTFINTTFNPLVELYRTHVDYRLWSLCNVPLPASDCGNGLPLNPPQDAQNCTLQELYFRLANHLCESNVGQPLVDALLQNSKCYSIARGWVEICSINANKETCAVALGSDVLLSSVDPPDQGDPLVTSLFQNCEESISSTSCNSSCQSAITNIKNSYGCCVSIFNESDSGVQPELSYNFWKSCGVETPGICTTSTLSGAAIMKALMWMIVVAMAIHVALCIH